MQLLHFSLDNLSMMALILDWLRRRRPIVMLENIVRHLDVRSRRSKRPPGMKEMPSRF